jgi:hypothetical protein
MERRYGRNSAVSHEARFSRPLWFSIELSVLHLNPSRDFRGEG